MSDQKAKLTLLRTGVPGLDDVLSGGLPEYSFNVVAGQPGSGKTTLVNQVLFANATASRPALSFTALGESSLKMLRHQQQMSFFDVTKVGEAIRFVDLNPDIVAGNLTHVLDAIKRHMDLVNPQLVAFDSLRSALGSITARGADLGDVQLFLQKLALHLSSWQATSFMVGEYTYGEMCNNPVMTIADGILLLSQVGEGNSVVRKLHVMKVRGQPHMPGLHTFRISQSGVRVFPRVQSRMESRRRYDSSRHTFGVARLDQMLGGGIPVGDAVVVAGPAGAGKTVLGTHFITEGARQGERSVLALFEEHPDEYLTRAKAQGADLASLIADKRLQMVCLRPLDLSPDEILLNIQQAVSDSGATRLVVDSLNGLELSLAPSFRQDFSEALFRMVGGLTGSGMSVLLTVEVAESFSHLSFSPHQISFLAQNIIFLRYVEIEGQLRRVLAVVKMRRSPHSPDLTEFRVGANGIEMGDRLMNLRGILTGVPMVAVPSRSAAPGLTTPEGDVLQAVMQLREATLKAVALATGMDPSAVEPALARLLQLNYAIRIGEGDDAVHRSVVTPLLA